VAAAFRFGPLDFFEIGADERNAVKVDLEPERKS
jgi:hypothetical protein